MTLVTLVTPTEKETVFFFRVSCLDAWAGRCHVWPWLIKEKKLKIWNQSWLPASWKKKKIKSIQKVKQNAVWLDKTKQMQISEGILVFKPRTLQKQKLFGCWLGFSSYLGCVPWVGRHISKVDGRAQPAADKLCLFVLLVARSKKTIPWKKKKKKKRKKKEEYPVTFCLNKKRSV